MPNPAPQIYRFDDFELDVSNRQLLRDGVEIPLPSKAFDMLAVLIQNSGQLVGKDELFARVWPDQIVEESNLTVQVSAIRKALGEQTSRPKYLLTVPGHGYRFKGQILSTAEDEVVIEHHSIAVIEANPESREATDTAAVAPHELIGRGAWRSRFWIFTALAAIAVLAISGVLVLMKRSTNSPTEEPPIKSIAVLPFKPLAAESRDESLELGFADTLITQLSGLPGLTVRPISAVRKFNGLEKNPIAEGRELQVDAVLEGHIQRAGDRVKINVRLLRVADGQSLMSETFDGKFSDLLAIQNRVSQGVSNRLAQRFRSREPPQLVKTYTQNSDAYQLYLLGRYFWNKRSEDGLKKAIECFNQAIEKDPNYALAYAGLADAYVVWPGQSSGRTKERSMAKVAAEMALKIDEQLPEAQTTLASISADNWEWTEAEQRFKRALELNPNYPTAHQWYAEYLVHLGRLDEAIQEMTRARELDPTSLIINTLLGEALYLARRNDEAIAQLEKTIAMDSGFATAHWILGKAYLLESKHDNATAEFQKAVELSGHAPHLLALLATAYERSGKHTEAKKIVSELNKLLKENRAQPQDLVVIYLGLGDKDQALMWLEKAYQDRSPVIFYVKTDPLFDPVRSDPRFANFVQRIEPLLAPNHN